MLMKGLLTACVFHLLLIAAFFVIRDIYFGCLLLILLSRSSYTFSENYLWGVLIVCLLSLKINNLIISSGTDLLRGSPSFNLQVSLGYWLFRDIPQNICRGHFLGLEKSICFTWLLYVWNFCISPKPSQIYFLGGH